MAGPSGLRGRRSLLAAAGLAIAGAGMGSYAPLFLGALGFTRLTFGIGLPIAAAGLFLAAGGLLRQPARSGRALLAGGFALAALAYGVITVDAFTRQGLYKAGNLLVEVGLAEAAWICLLWLLQPRAQEEAPRRLAILQICFAAMAAGSIWIEVVNQTSPGNGSFTPSTVLTIAGLLVAVRFVRPEAPPTIPRQEPKTSPPSVPQAHEDAPP